eukprot:Nitzschia sp. Nitz4//scaffold34_size148208//77427//78809//NITZ4_002981-RA/size148208-processed-gene-0.47-mRNA-1//-1//CDS//3329548798//6525//frame0
MAETKKEEPTSEEDNGPSETDLVIRDNFPALRIPGTNLKQPMIDGDEPIPRHKFWTMEHAITFDEKTLPLLLEDCETVFTARDKPNGNSYSAGQTFFLPANMEPRCALEALAQSIFRKHTEHLEEGTYNPAQSGANWWTLVLEGPEETSAAAAVAKAQEEEEQDEEDEVGLHFDADYELEEQTTNVLLHPRVGTVTYLSDVGAPTFILDQPSPPMDDLQKSTLEKGISKAWLSHPRVGKHTAFDGRLLHGAPALYFPSHQQLQGQLPTDAATKETVASAGDGDEKPSATERPQKRQKLDEEDKQSLPPAPGNQKRYTLLVNVWLNHWVMDAGLLDEGICSQLKTPWKKTSSDEAAVAAATASATAEPFTWNPAVDMSKPSTDVETVKLAPSNVDPAGEDELALCNHTVTIKYNPLMEECHAASAKGSSVALELEEGTITLHVGEELQEEASGDEDGEEEE